uniref:GLIPR1-like protein 1 n=1 Tax=Schistosoma japonicum TaxID=6182 RepID=C1LE34_SCHJA|nr:GLIPR1-like protein 1 precursor [Schistosoma japonicum]
MFTYEGTKVRLLTLHNDARKSVVEGKLMGQPMAISMEPLKWDKELERKAQILADNCSFAHDNVTNRSTSSFEHVGQNIARADSVDIAFGLWLNESRNFNFSSQSCLKGQCKHYTQIVWENTTHIGCGVATCKNSPFTLSIVCNYGPGGNLIGQVPYRLKIENKLIKPEIQNCNVRKYTYPLITFVPRLGPSLIKPLHSPNVSRI